MQGHLLVFGIQTRIRKSAEPSVAAAYDQQPQNTPLA